MGNPYFFYNDLYDNIIEIIIKKGYVNTIVL